ncbi:MAG: undecaprenyldiphospho-muramoylpentapeptide beta-N-acetylglucosaminyltransferase [Bacilli bacterium]|nr:undecaprenyldiphospho-muramoylpentapeptide beta-N-acetylglucosaminyltransferase [Bacilli bacterium]
MKIIVSAGGSGGHIYPALAIIDKFKEKEKKLEILYIGTTDRMEKDIIPQHNINYIGIRIRGLDRGIHFKNLKAIDYFFKAFKKVKKIIKEFKPDIVIGVGGYVTGPVIYAAKKMKVKTVIHEQNTFLGLSNRFLLRYVDKVFTSFECTKDNTKKYKDKLIFTGNPTSESYLKKKSANKKDYGLSLKKKLVLFVMGSQGSKKINEKMKKILLDFKDKDYEILYVTGKGYYNEFVNIDFPKNVKIYEFIENMGSLLKVTDLIVTRAGASTICETTTLGVPSIFIPSPYVTDNHQYYNAMDLVNKGAAIILEEEKLNKSNLINKIDEILNNKNKYDEIKDNLSKIAIKDSATKIYNEIKKII